MEIENESYPPDNEASNPRRLTAPNAPVSSLEKIMSNLISASKTLGAVVAISGVGFAFGRYLEEAKMHETVAKLQTENVVKSTDLEKSKADISAWSNAYRELKQRLVQQEAEVARLNLAVGNNQNCNYFREQIESTKHDIAIAQNSGIFAMNGDKLSEQKQANIDRLDKHLSELIGKLDTCGRGGA